MHRLRASSTHPQLYLLSRHNTRSFFTSVSTGKDTKPSLVLDWNDIYIPGQKDKPPGETDKSQPDVSSLTKKAPAGLSFARRLMELREAKAGAASLSSPGSTPPSRPHYEDPIIAQRRFERLERERKLKQFSGNTTSTLPSKDLDSTLQSPHERPTITQQTPEHLERDSNHLSVPPRQAPQITSSEPRTLREDPTIIQRRLERVERERKWMESRTSMPGPPPPSEAVARSAESEPRTLREDPTIIQRRLERVERERRWMESRTSMPGPPPPSEAVARSAESSSGPPRDDPSIAQRRNERFGREKSMYPSQDFTPTPIPKLATSSATPSGTLREDPTIALRRAERLERERRALLKNLEPRPHVNKNAQGSGDEVSYSRPFASRASLKPTGIPAPGTGKHNIKTKEKERLRNAKHRPKLTDLESMPVGPPNAPERPEITFNNLDNIFKPLSLSRMDTFTSWKDPERALEIRGGDYSDFAPSVVDFNKQPKLDIVTLARFSLAKNRDITLERRREVLKIVEASGTSASVQSDREVHV